MIGEPDHRGAWGEVSDAITADLLAETVTFRMSGLAWSQAMDAGWPEECPSGAAALRSAPVRRQGRGRTHTVTMTVADADDLIDYLLSVVGCWETMTSDELGNDRPRTIHTAIDRIREAMA